MPFVRHGHFDRRLPLTTTFRLEVIVQTHEYLDGLKGLVMDNCDRLSKKYGYRDEQFKWPELVRRTRCVDCHGKYTYVVFDLQRENNHLS